VTLRFMMFTRPSGVTALAMIRFTNSELG
jgi:hypothetical protein